MPYRQHFSDSLREVTQDILKMGTLVEEALQKSIQAFEEKNTELAEEVIRADVEINDLQLAIEDKCTILIATENPVASDLRKLITGIKIVSNLERIGDHAVHLGKTTIRLANEGYIEQMVELIPAMAEMGLSMVRDTLTAFLNNDSKLATDIANRDEELDRFHKKIFSNLLDFMKKDPKYVDQATDLLFVIRFLERLGDHVTNMCEWIVFCDTGEHVELNL